MRQGVSWAGAFVAVVVVWALGAGEATCAGPPPRLVNGGVASLVVSTEARTVTPARSIREALREWEEEVLWVGMDAVAQHFTFGLSRMINVYSSRPNRRILELLNNSEDLREIEKEWEAIWSTDHPAPVKPVRVLGGIE